MNCVKRFTKIFWETEHTVACGLPCSKILFAPLSSGESELERVLEFPVSRKRRASHLKFGSFIGFSGVRLGLTQ